MSDDVRLSTGLPQHPKTKKLHRRLGGDGCWALVRLFLWAGEHRWEGDLSGLSDEDIELAVDWGGAPDALIAALVEVRFLAGPAGKRRIHDWHEHNPYAASKGQRIAKGKAAATARWERAKAGGGHAPSTDHDAPSMPRACPEHATRKAEQCPPAPAPAPAPAEPPDRSLHARNNAEGAREAEPPVSRGTDAGTACRLMREAGCASTNPSHPSLLAALTEGVTPEASRDTAREAIEAGKSNPFVWAVTAARNRHAEGATAPRPSQTTPRNTAPSRQATAIARARQRFCAPEETDDGHDHPRLVQEHGR